MADPFTGDEPRMGAIPENLDDQEQAFRSERRRKKRQQREIDEERAEEVKDRLYSVALGLIPDATSIEIQAAREFMDRAVGKPIQTTITASVDDVKSLSDDELRNELARLGGAAADAASGGGAEEDPE